MPYINLIPWREKNIICKNRIFGFITGTCCVITFALCLGSKFFVSLLVENKKSDISYIKKEIKSVESQSKEIAELKAVKLVMLEKQQSILKLKKSQFSTITILDNTAKAVPEGVFIKEMKRQESVLQINGSSTSNSRVSQFMLNLKKYNWVSDTILEEIKAKSAFSKRSDADNWHEKFDFKLTLILRE